MLIRLPMVIEQKRRPLPRWCRRFGLCWVMFTEAITLLVIIGAVIGYVVLFAEAVKMLFGWYGIL